MFFQNYNPLGNAFLSTVVAAIPIAGRLGKFRFAFSSSQRIDRQLPRFSMHLQFEAVGQEGLEHLPLYRSALIGGELAELLAEGGVGLGLDVEPCRGDG